MSRTIIVILGAQRLHRRCVRVDIASCYRATHSLRTGFEFEDGEMALDYGAAVDTRACGARDRVGHSFLSNR